jgi:spermidine synthase
VEDARQFIRRGSGRFAKYDLIILDAYSGGGQIPAHLVTREFLGQVRERLAPDGVLVSNIIATMKGRLNRFYRAEYRTIGQLFPNIYVFPVVHPGENPEDLPPSTLRNLLLVAPREGTRRLAASELYASAEELVRQYPLAKDLNLLYHAGNYHATDRPEEMTDVPVLTDEYAPVETMFWYERHGR